MKHPPNSIFFNTFDQRIDLARRRYFEEGLLPSGIVDNAIFESWLRCQRKGSSPCEKVEFNEVTYSRVELAKQKNRSLLNAWSVFVSELERTLSGTACSAVLTDVSGVLIACIGQNDIPASITRHAHRVGVNLSEEAVGTTAPGLALKTGKVVTVRAGEHYFNGVNRMYCAAAPIRNTKGHIAGVLNIAREGAPFIFQASALVSLYAASIENRYLISESPDEIIICIQLNPSLLDTPYVGLLGCTPSGEITWRNHVAEQLLGLTDSENESYSDTALNVFGCDINTLVARSCTYPLHIQLATGLSAWIKTKGSYVDTFTQKSNTVSPRVLSIQSENTADQSHPINPDKPSFEPPNSEQDVCRSAGDTNLSKTFSSLKDCDIDIVLTTVEKFNGNIAKAARELKVSRGLIYRRLKNKKQPARN